MVLKLSGPAVTPPNEQQDMVEVEVEVEVEADGGVTFVWKITKYGKYTVSGTHALGSNNPISIRAGLIKQV